MHVAEEVRGIVFSVVARVEARGRVERLVGAEGAVARERDGERHGLGRLVGHRHRAFRCIGGRLRILRRKQTRNGEHADGDDRHERHNSDGPRESAACGCAANVHVSRRRATCARSACRRASRVGIAARTRLPCARRSAPTVARGAGAGVLRSAATRGRVDGALALALSARRSLRATCRMRPVVVRRPPPITARRSRRVVVRRPRTTLRLALGRTIIEAVFAAPITPLAPRTPMRRIPVLGIVAPPLVHVRSPLSAAVRHASERDAPSETRRPLCVDARHFASLYRAYSPLQAPCTEQLRRSTLFFSIVNTIRNISPPPRPSDDRRLTDSERSWNGSRRMM